MKTKNLWRWAKCACKPCRYRSQGDRIFLCYRQADSEIATDTLHDTLNKALGDERVFKDVTGIGPGVVYMEAVRRELESCGAVLVVIGRHWLSVQDENGKRRIDDPKDPVRQELEYALTLRDSNRLRLIPVLVAGASMPARRSLPRTLRPLCSSNAWDLARKSFRDDAKALAADLKGPKPKHFGGWAVQRDVAPAWALVLNALWRPFWSNTLLPAGIVAAGLVTGATWVLLLAAAVYLGLVLTTLFDKQQARCVHGCLQELRTDGVAPSTLARR